MPGLEEVWDAILTSGTLLYGVAVDDAHIFKDPGNPDVAGPGRGWVVSGAAAGGASAARRLERGDFYASTGVELSDYRGDRADDRDRQSDRFSKYRIQFIGKGGRCCGRSLDRRRPTRFEATKATCARA